MKAHSYTDTQIDMELDIKLESYPQLSDCKMTTLSTESQLPLNYLTSLNKLQYLLRIYLFFKYIFWEGCNIQYIILVIYTVALIKLG